MNIIFYNYYTKPFSTKGMGDFELIQGCMFSGKSTALINKIRKSRQCDHVARVYKHSYDTRYSITNIVSHDGESESASAVSSAEDIEKDIGSSTAIVSHIYIDEGQFFGPTIVNWINVWLKRGINIVVAGLDIDSEERPFGSMNILKNAATCITCLHAKCSECGELTADHTIRTNCNSDEVVQIGGSEMYKPACRDCFNLSRSR